MADTDDIETRRYNELMAMSGGNNPLAIIPNTVEQVFVLSQAIASSGLAPYGMQKAEQITVAILMGLELGLPPMQSIQNIAVVNGKPSLYGDIGLSLIYRSGLLESFEEHWDGEETAETKDFPVTYKAVVTMKRKGLPAVTEEFSVADAKRAMLWDGMGLDSADKKAKSPWRLHPKIMLRWRARWRVWRALFTDVLKNMTGVEEMQGEVVDVTPREVPPEKGRAKFSGGEAVDIEYVSTRPAASKPAATSAPAAAEAPAGQPTAETGEAAQTQVETPQTTSEPQRGDVEDRWPNVTDMFEKGALQELTDALAKVTDTAALAVLEDEFNATITMASAEGGKEMRALMATKAEELKAG